MKKYIGFDISDKRTAVCVSSSDLPAKPHGELLTRRSRNPNPALTLTRAPTGAS